MSKEVSKREQPEEVAKLTTDEAEKALENSVALIDKLRPKEPKWVKDYCSDKPLRGRHESEFIVALAVSSGLGGLVLGMISSSIFSQIMKSSIDSSSLNILIGLHLGTGLIAGLATFATATVPKFIASGYKGSQTKQPIRAKLARLFYKKELDALEYRLRDYESYQQALEAHQIVIDREHQKLEEQKVFEILSAGIEFINLDKNGRIETVDKPFKDTVAGEQYEDISLRIINYLQDEKKAIDSKTNTAQ